MTRLAWMGAISGLACFVLGVLAGVATRPAPPAAGFGAPNDVDVGFSQDMAVHHTQAVLMAGIVLDRPGASAPVRALATQIELGQAEEIGMLHGWLRLWNAPGLSSAPMVWMTGGLCSAADAQGNSPMPGLASEPELEELRTAQGPALDAIFLRLMRHHHVGGAGMMRAAIAGADAPQVRALAREMLFEQSEEIGYMDQIIKITATAGDINIRSRAVR